MASLASEWTGDLDLYVGEILSVTGADANGKGNSDDLAYSVFLRNYRDKSVTIELQGHKPRRPGFKNVEVIAAKPGDPVQAYKTSNGLFVVIHETLEFTENCE